MADITITGKVAERLQQLARQTNRSIEVILEEALDTYQEGNDTAAIEPPQG